MPDDDASRSSLADGTLPSLPSGLSEIHVSEAAPGRPLAERTTARLRLVPPRAAGRVTFDELAARRALYPRRTVGFIERHNANPHTGQSHADESVELLREALEHMVRGVESLLSSLPFSAPENIGFLVNAKLGEPAQDARDALGWDLEDA